jgi:hypothetical protein
MMLLEPAFYRRGIDVFSGTSFCKLVDSVTFHLNEVCGAAKNCFFPHAAQGAGLVTDRISDSLDDGHLACPMVSARAGRDLCSLSANKPIFGSFFLAVLHDPRMRHSMGERPSYLGVGQQRDGSDFERVTARSMTFGRFSIAWPFVLRSISCRRGSHAFVKKLIEELVVIDVLHEGCACRPKRCWRRNCGRRSSR